jgi:hypothetical protein
VWRQLDVARIAAKGANGDEHKASKGDEREAQYTSRRCRGGLRRTQSNDREGLTRERH